jgi:methylase of polypeptide subunit release factors
MHNTLIRLVTGAVSRELEWVGFLADYASMTARMRQPGVFSIGGLEIHTGAGVYQPGPGSSTQFIADHLNELLPRGAKSVLEIGCGSGALALLSARRGLTVDACDIDPIAVHYTNENARRNDIALSVCQSDLFGAFQDRTYDTILFNLPFYHPSDPITDHERPLADPNGQLITRFLNEAHRHLAPGGHIAFTFANCGQVSVLQRSDWEMEVAALDYQRRNNFVRLIVRASSLRQPDGPNTSPGLVRH